MKYVVGGTIHFNEAIEAEDMREAVCEARRRYPHAHLIFVEDENDGYDIIGFCEGCNKPIFDNDTYYSSSDGCYVCAVCAADAPITDAD
jgi:hypothetical protein